MSWTKEAPTEPGWYWWKTDDQLLAALFVVVIDTGSKKYRALSTTDGVRILPSHGEWWSIPIEKPDANR